MVTCWLPNLFELDLNNWSNTEDVLYDKFVNDFIKGKSYFRGKPIRIRKHPLVNEREEAFYHVTCKKFEGYSEREPDMRRCERIDWIKAFIEFYAQCKNCNKCSGIKIWKTPIDNRIYLLLEEQRYVVILEERSEYILLITAFYVDYQNTMRKLLLKYEKYKNKIDCK